MATLGAQTLVCFRQHFLERTQHQLQRRAEFMADVAEECGLGAIDLGHRVGAGALVLVRASAGQPDGNLFGDPTHELAAGIIERSARIDSQNEEPRHSAVFAETNRHDCSFFRSYRPGGGRQQRCALAQIDDNSLIGQCDVESPEILPRAVDRRRAQHLGCDTGAYQIRVTFAGAIRIKECERNREAMFAESFRAGAPDVLLASRFYRSVCQIAHHL